MWLTPDAYDQYFNPYSYGGGDPANGVDADGNIFGLIATGIALWDELSEDDDVSLSRIGKAGLFGFGADALTPSGFAGVLTVESFAERMFADDNKNKTSTLTDFLWGGEIGDFAGHYLGTYNTIFGGEVDNYNGIKVYSGGFMNKEGAGYAHFGHAVFVDDRSDKDMIAHEIRHVKQMELWGGRIRYYLNYLAQNDWKLSGDGNDAYETNDFEISAYYNQYLYHNGYIDIYGNKLKPIDHAKAASGADGSSYNRQSGFVNWYNSIKSTRPLDPTWKWVEGVTGIGPNY